MKVEPYLFFEGRCEEALKFYQEALGAEVLFLMRNEESPDQTMCIPGAERKILHCLFRIGDSTICGSDGQCLDEALFKGFSLVLTVSSDAEAERLFARLSEGGEVQMPMAETFYSSRFGMVADRFGVPWMILVEA